MKLTDTFFVNWLMLHIYIVHGELDWIVYERVSGYGDNVTLFCLVDDCCNKAAGWIKFDPDYTTIFLDVRDFKYKTSKKDKYAATTNSAGFGLVINNVREDDFNINYLCSYGFEKSRQKVLYQTDTFKVDEPKSELLAVIIGSIVAVILVAVVVLIIVKLAQKRREQQCKQNDKSSTGKHEQNNTRSKPHKSQFTNIKFKKMKLRRKKRVVKSEQHKSTITEDLAEVIIIETVNDASKQMNEIPSELLQKIDEVVTRTVEQLSKDNHSPQSEQLLQNFKECHMEIQNDSEGIVTVHRVGESKSQE